MKETSAPGTAHHDIIPDDSWATQLEYNHVLSELARYDDHYTKAIPVLSFLFTVVFGIAIVAKADYAFLIVPILSICAIQSLIANTYQILVRELYLYELESTLSKDHSPFHRFYSTHMRRFQTAVGKLGHLLHPTRAVGSMFVFILLALGAYGAVRSWKVLAHGHGLRVAILYCLGCASLCTYSLASFFWSVVQLSKDEKSFVAKQTTASKQRDTNGGTQQ